MAITVEKLSDPTRTFIDGSTLTVISPGLSIVVSLPGWKWSQHVQPLTGKSSEAHIGYIISGHMKVISPNGDKTIIGPKEKFSIGPNHDAWTVGEEPCVSLDLTPLEKDRTT